MLEAVQKPWNQMLCKSNSALGFFVQITPGEQLFVKVSCTVSVNLVVIHRADSYFRFCSFTVMTCGKNRSVARHLFILLPCQVHWSEVYVSKEVRMLCMEIITCSLYLVHLYHCNMLLLSSTSWFHALDISLIFCNSGYDQRTGQWGVLKSPCDRKKF